MKPLIKEALSLVPIRQLKNNNGRIKRMHIYKGILILLISVPSFAGNSKLDAGKNCPSMMKCMEEKMTEENIESIIQPSELATTVLCRFLIN